ncbi:MAG: type II toxin-antitoxin system HicA family toxin [Deltaproteobacteria bacterium]|nr:type II toxin-antitoxin system HicA family toxin [Deltaproteobacteria bacterium]
MPPKLKLLSGSDVVAVLSKFGFCLHSQRGSHMKLRRITREKLVQTLTIPNHKEIDRGTLRAIIRQASKFVLESELRPCFYTE